jgi:hypothetical protein
MVLSWQLLNCEEFMIKLNSKTGIAVGAGILVTIAVVTGLSISRNTSATPGVKSVSTTVSSNKADNKISSPASDAATSPSQTNAPSSQPAHNTKKQTAAAASATTAKTTSAASTLGSSANPSAPSNPVVTPAPAPKPTYRIDLHGDLAQTIDMSQYGGGLKQLKVPFNIIYDEGFIKADYHQPGCHFTSTPTIDHGVFCDLSQKESDTGWVVMQYSSTSAKGHYKVEAIYPIGDITRTDTYEFDLN